MSKVPCTWHHKRPRSLFGTNEPNNLIYIKATHHTAWHTLFKNFGPHRIAKLINKLYLDPDYEFVVVERRNPANLPSRKE